MAKKKKLEPTAPSKAYLVSFGDTMTALLAFFIVLNSLAKEQTGANMHSGTGSFVSAFANSGSPGELSGNRSREMIQQKRQAPIYALAENLSKNEGNVGPDDTGKRDRILDRNKEQFQKFLSEIEKAFGLKSHKPIKNQMVFDSFEPWDRETGAISNHAVQLISESVAKLRDPSVKLEVIVWATMPNKRSLESQLKKTEKVRSDVERMFWLKPNQRSRIRYSAKPWLFSDARRPILSVVFSRS